VEWHTPGDWNSAVLDPGFSAQCFTLEDIWHYNTGRREYDTTTVLTQALPASSYYPDQNKRPVLSFQSWLDNESSPDYDRATITVNASGVAPETFTLPNGATGEKQMWVAKQFPLPLRFIGKSISVTLKFDTIDENFNDQVGWCAGDFMIIDQDYASEFPYMIVD
jgi:hypothetical protein